MLKLPCSFGLAPMAGYTNLPFREIAYEHGACFAYTEMISARSVFKAYQKVLKMLPSLKEPFTGIQIYGSNPEYILKAAEKLQTFGKFIDINAGCPVKKVVKKGMGGALLRNLDKLFEMVRILKGNLSVPVTVKTRIGWDKDEVDRIYDGLVRSGADMVVFHARTVKQMFRGKADWKSISRIKDRSVPLFISGDIFSPEDAVKALELSGADGVLIARGAVGNPWIFSQIKSLIETGYYEEPGLEERIRVMMDHLKRNIEFLGERKGIVEFRKFVAGYTKSLKNSREFRSLFMKIQSYESAVDIVRDFFGSGVSV